MSLRIDVIRRHLEASPSHRQIVANATSGVDSRLSGVFEYTLDNSKLTLEQRQFYETNGYLLIPKLIEDEILDECSERFVNIANGKFVLNNMLVMRDQSLKHTDKKGEYLINKIQDILDDEVFLKYFKHKELIDYVECFTGPNVKGIHSMLINKPPDSKQESSVHPHHQDLHYFPIRPANRIVASWTAMEKVYKENGCLFVIPGSHTGPLLPHNYGSSKINFAYHGIDGYANAEVKLVEMEKGDTIFFHPLLIHGSGHNLTKGFRKSISCHYAACDAYYIDVTDTSQETISKEVENKVGISYQDVWRIKSRLIRGKDINL